MPTMMRRAMAGTQKTVCLQTIAALVDTDFRLLYFRMYPAAS